LGGEKSTVPGGDADKNRSGPGGKKLLNPGGGGGGFQKKKSKNSGGYPNHPLGGKENKCTVTKEIHGQSKKKGLWGGGGVVGRGGGGN